MGDVIPFAARQNNPHTTAKKRHCDRVDTSDRNRATLERAGKTYKPNGPTGPQHGGNTEVDHEEA